MKNCITYTVNGSKKKITLPVYDPEMNFLQRYDRHMRSNLQWFMICFVVVTLFLFMYVQGHYDQVQYKEAKILVEQFRTSIVMAEYYFTIGNINEGQLRLAYCNHNWPFVIERARLIHPHVIGSESHIITKKRLEYVNQQASLSDSSGKIIEIPKPVVIRVSKEKI